MKSLHQWNVSIPRAVRIQEELKRFLVLKRTSSEVRTVAGGDVAYSKERGLLFSAIVVLSFPDLKTTETGTASGSISFPYIPGLFAFREGPILIEAFRQLKMKPDVLLLDGHGIAHPRGFGLASHIGVWLDIPSIGCAKTALSTDFSYPEYSEGSFEIIRKDSSEIGAVLRTRKGTRPVFVSPGHRVDLMTSVELVLRTCRRFRIPEPLRRAHHTAVKLRDEPL